MCNYLCKLVYNYTCVIIIYYIHFVSIYFVYPSPARYDKSYDKVMTSYDKCKFH